MIFVKDIYKCFSLKNSLLITSTDQLFSLPNMVEIFHREDQDGDTSAYLAGNHFFSENSDTRTWWGYAHSLTKVDSVLNVHWSGPGGQRAKFSLVQKIKDYIYQVFTDLYILL